MTAAPEIKNSDFSRTLHRMRTKRHAQIKISTPQTRAFNNWCTERRAGFENLRKSFDAIAATPPISTSKPTATPAPSHLENSNQTEGPDL